MNTKAEIRYFNVNATECWRGSVLLTTYNIDVALSKNPGSCVALGLKRVKCPKNTYACGISSSRTSETLAVGDKMNFGCETKYACDNIPGINCIPENYSNCQNGPISVEDSSFLVKYFQKMV